MIPSGQFFTRPDAWLNGFYEIEIDLGESSDEKLAEASGRIWEHPLLSGCYLHRDREPQAQEPVNPAEHLNSHHYGIAHLFNGADCVCGTFTATIDSGSLDGPHDFLAFYLPLASLAKTFPGGRLPYPELDVWLVDLGRFVFERIKFDLALIGFEVVFPEMNTDQLRLDGLPGLRREGYLLQVNGKLEWFPRLT